MLEYSEEIKPKLVSEEDELNSQFYLIEEQDTTLSTIGGFEKDLQLNAGNFNLIKNSNAFKSNA